MIQGQFPGGKYLDDLDPETFTEEEKQTLIDLLAKDPYAFYGLWRDPNAAQRFIEGDHFQTTQVDELYTKIGALRLAGAPDYIVRWWQQVLENKGRRPNKNLLGLTARTKVIPDKMHQIENFCKHIDEDLNYVRTNRTDDLTDDFPEELPFAQKWQNIMSAACGEPPVVEIHKGTVRHYKADDPVEAASGTEIVEITITGRDLEIDMESYADDAIDVIENHISPYAMQVKHYGDTVTILLKFYDIYE